MFNFWEGFDMTDTTNTISALKQAIDKVEADIRDSSITTPVNEIGGGIVGTIAGRHLTGILLKKIPVLRKIVKDQDGFIKWADDRYKEYALETDDTKRADLRKKFKEDFEKKYRVKPEDAQKVANEFFNAADEYNRTKKIHQATVTRKLYHFSEVSNDGDLVKTRAIRNRARAQYAQTLKSVWEKKFTAEGYTPSNETKAKLVDLMDGKITPETFYEHLHAEMDAEIKKAPKSNVDKLIAQQEAFETFNSNLDNVEVADPADPTKKIKISDLHERYATAETKHTEEVSKHAGMDEEFQRAQRALGYQDVFDAAAGERVKTMKADLETMIRNGESSSAIYKYCRSKGMSMTAANAMASSLEGENIGARLKKLEVLDNPELRFYNQAEIRLSEAGKGAKGWRKVGNTIGAIPAWGGKLVLGGLSVGIPFLLGYAAVHGVAPSEGDPRLTMTTAEYVKVNATGIPEDKKYLFTNADTIGQCKRTLQYLYNVKLIDQNEYNKGMLMLDVPGNASVDPQINLRECLMNVYKEYKDKIDGKGKVKAPASARVKAPASAQRPSNGGGGTLHKSGKDITDGTDKKGPPVKPLENSDGAAGY